MVPLIRLCLHAGPWEFGVFENFQGERTDLIEVRDAIMNGMSKRDVYLQFPNVAARAFKYIEELLIMYKEDQIARLTDFQPKYIWQEVLLDLIAGEPDDRQILWVYDPIGGLGKSYMSKYLVDTKGAFYCNGGKGNDLVYAYDGEPICIFDYVRDSRDYVNYGPMEQIKNGMLFSSKYNSRVKRFNKPHVIVMANFLPDKFKLSRDRYFVLHATDTDIKVVPYEELPAY